MSFRTAYHSLNKRTSPKPKLIRDYTDEEWAKLMDEEWAKIMEGEWMIMDDYLDDYYKQQQAKKK